MFFSVKNLFMFILNLTTGTLSFENVRNGAGLPPRLTAETRKANAVLGT